MKKTLLLACLFTFCLFLVSADSGQAIPAMTDISLMEEISSLTIPETAMPQTTAQTTTAQTTTEQTISETTAATLLSEEKQSALSQQMQEIFLKYNVVGMSVAVFQGQDILYTSSQGFADVKRAIPADNDTKYRIASVSKTITGILAMQLVSDGRLDLDTDISDYMALNMRSPFFPDQKITSRQLMTHTSGIVDSVKYEEITDGYVYPSLTGLIEYGGLYTNYPPGTRYIYSNLAYGLLCGVIEGVTLDKFYTYAKDSLFDPMGIDAGFLRTQIQNSEDIALIYEKNELSANTKSWGRVESAYDTIPIGQMYLLGYGDLFISAQDLAKFGIALAGDGHYGDFQVLSPEAVEEMNALQFKTAKVERGLALSITEDLVSGRTLYGHPGQSYGMVSGLYYDPTDSSGVVFLTNGCNVQKNGYGIYTITDALVKAVYSTLF